MRTSKFTFGFLVLSIALAAQERNPTQQAPPQAAPPQAIVPVPLYRVEVVERTTPAVNYLHRSGPTLIDFRGTPLMPRGKGVAQVENQRGVIRVYASFKNMAPPSSFGREYLTYLLWAV